jgi:hypothetical protein
MTARLARVAAVALVLVLASASAAASAGRRRPAVAISAFPAHARLSVGTGRAVVRVRNNGEEPVVVDVRRAGFALDLRGRPRIVAAGAVRRSAARWLSFRPRTIGLRPGATSSVTVVSRRPRKAEPGDHDALVLLTTRRHGNGRVAVRMRVGVVVVVRVPGAVRRRLELRRVRVVGRARGRTLELFVANRGNVSESFSRAASVISIRRAGGRIVRLTAAPRSLRPGTVGVLQFRSRGKPLGPVVARVHVTSQAGTVVRRTLRLRL